MQKQIWRVLLINRHLWTDAELDDVPLTTPIQLRRRRVHARELVDKSVDLAQGSRQRLRYIFNTLVKTEWLELVPIGRYYHVDMRPVQKRLARFLVQIENGFETQLAGVMTQVKNSLLAVARAKDPRDEAAGLLHARESFTNFVADLATLDGIVRDIEREIFSKSDPSERVLTFAREFIDKLLLKDFKAIRSTHHPFKQKDKTLRLVMEFLADSYKCELISQGLMRDDDQLTQADAIAKVYLCLEDIQSGFEVVSDYLERLSKKQRSIERRISSTMKFVFSGRTNILATIQSQLRQVHRLPSGANIPSPYERKDRILSPQLLAQPRGRKIIRTKVKVEQAIEPVEIQYRRQLIEMYGRVAQVTPKTVKEFLQRQGFSAGARRLSEANTDSLHDFLIADAIRVSLMKGSRKNNPYANLVLKEFKVAPCRERWVGKWASGPDFQLTPRTIDAA